MTTTTGLKLRYMEWSGANDTGPGRYVERTPEQFITVYPINRAEHKNSSLAIKMGSMEFVPGPGKRKIKVMPQIWGAEADYDGEKISVAQAAKMLKDAGVAGMIVESFSSSPEKPRWKVFSPTSKALDSAIRDELVDKLNTVFKGELAGESWAPTQMMFVSGRGECIWVDGDPVDTASVPRMSRRDVQIKTGNKHLSFAVNDFDLPGGVEVPDSAPISSDTIIEKAMVGHEVHDGVLALTMKLAKLGFGPEDVMTRNAQIGFARCVEESRGSARSADIFGMEWDRALSGALSMVNEKEKKRKESTGDIKSNILVPFKLSDSIAPAPTSIRGYLPSDGIGVIWGAPSSFKSFLSLDMAISIASGIEWHKRKVKRGIVWYLAGEGQSGTERRVRAWMQEHDIKQDAIDGHLFYTPKSLLINETSGEPTPHINALLGEIKNGNIPSHIFVDTIARTMSGDENTSKDMGAYIRAIEVLIDAIRDAGESVCVVLVHHSRKDGDVYRGSSALKGAADFEFEVRRENMSVVVDCHKMKDFAEPPPQTFKVVELPLGEAVDEWGISSAVFSLVLRRDESSALDQTIERFEPIRKAIESGHGTSRIALKTALGAKGNKALDTTLKYFMDEEWLVSTDAGSGKPREYKIGPKAPPSM